LHFLDRQRAGLADQMQFDQGDFFAAFAVNAALHVRKGGDALDQEFVFPAFGAGVRFEDKDHGEARFPVGIEQEPHIILKLIVRRAKDVAAWPAK
jgi:hypothetical protein